MKKNKPIDLVQIILDILVLAGLIATPALLVASKMTSTMHPSYGKILNAGFIIGSITLLLHIIAVSRKHVTRKDKDVEGQSAD
ncbi:MAG: hypothetical protein GX850_00250 [Clostridiaceae bacterium]|jgi:hypothetical protein|nr:hypothetical protein [Clostridiaceae bacterium]